MARPTTAQILAIRKALAGGFTVKAIAEHFGFTRATVDKYGKAPPPETALDHFVDRRHDDPASPESDCAVCVEHGRVSWLEREAWARSPAEGRRFLDKLNAGWTPPAGQQ